MSDDIDCSWHTETRDEEYRETDGRSVVIDIDGYYKVQAWGDPEDSFDEVMEKTEKAADRAKKDIKDLNDKTDSDSKTYS